MTLSLVRRHVRLFFRDRAAVFFSLLSPLILFVIYVFFLGQVQVESLRGSLQGASNASVHHFIDAWLFAGVLTITTLSSALVALGVFVDDRTSQRFKDFLVAPLTRRQLISGYMIAAFVVSVVMSTIVGALGQVYVVLRGGPLISATHALQTFGGILLLSLTFSAIMSFAVTFISSSSAFSAFNTIVGTAVGFLAGAYITVSALPAGVVNVINVLPFAQAAGLIRRPFTASALDKVSGGVTQVRTTVANDYGVNLVIGGHTVAVSVVVVIFVALIAVFTGLGSWRIGAKID